MDSRLGNLSFTGAGLGRDHQLVPRGTAPAGDKPCGCCGADCVTIEGRVCGTCRRQGSEPWQDEAWRAKVAAAIAVEPPVRRWWQE